jgi:hypothetical protein
MFRTLPRPSSGDYNYISSLWFYRWSVAVAALLVVVWQVTCQTTTNNYKLLIMHELTNIKILCLCSSEMLPIVGRYLMSEKSVIDWWRKLRNFAEEWKDRLHRGRSQISVAGLVEWFEGKKSPARARGSWYDNIKACLEETFCECTDQIYRAQHND